MPDQQKWIEIPEVCRQIELAATVAANRLRIDFIRGFSNMYRCNWPRMESPLEAIFNVWWEAVTHFDTDVQTLVLRRQHEVTCNGNRYRLDFMIDLRDQSAHAVYASAGRPFPLIAVEVDGHEFHERTREQVAQRNARDRDLQQDGWKVFHFSWAELVSDGARHVGSVAAFAYDAAHAAEEAVYRAHREENETADAAAVNEVGSTTREAT